MMVQARSILAVVCLMAAVRSHESVEHEYIINPHPSHLGTNPHVIPLRLEVVQRSMDGNGGAGACYCPLH
jgi:hypothetical protein